MATTVPKAFAEFAQTIKPTEAQEQTIAGRRTSVQNFLLAKYPAGSTMALTETRVIGSAGRSTLIRPVDDVDVFCVFDHSNVWASYKKDSRQLLYRVREALTGSRVETVGSRGQAVRLFYKSGPHVDITPAFRAFNPILRTPAGFYIPRGDGGWQQTDPYRHHDFMVQRNQELGYHLKPLVRLLKRWNRTHSNRVRSFHLELIARDVFTGMNGNMREATRLFFEHAGAYAHLHVREPSGYSGDLAAGMTAIQQLNIKQSFVNAGDHARRAQLAEAMGKVQEALRQWRIVFGDEFPLYG